MVIRQSGSIDVAVTIGAVPPPLGDEWADVAELSFTPTAPAQMTGWEPFDPTPLPLEVGASYRMRWAIADADRASETWEPPYPERHRLDLWPAPESPPTLAFRSEIVGIFVTQDTYHPVV